LGQTRVEIILPTGGEHQSKREESAWNDLLKKVASEWPPPEGKSYAVPRGNTLQLASAVLLHHPSVPQTEIEDFIKKNYKEGKTRSLTGEDVQRVKDLISQVGSLEFLILANDGDDREAMDAAKKYFEDAKNDQERKTLLERLNLQGNPPPNLPGD